MLLDLFTAFFILCAMGIVAYLLKRQGPGYKGVPLHHLKEVKPFAHLNQRTLKAISLLIDEVHLPKGHCVIKEHNSDDSLFYLLKGKVNILKKGEFYPSLVKDIDSGEFFGEMAFLTGSRRIASAVVVEDSFILRIKKENYVEILGFAPGLDDAIWDACDRHSISLCLADYEELRSMNSARRIAWIEEREVVKSGPGDLMGPKGLCWLSIIRGSITHRGQRYEAPCLLKIDDSLDVIAETPIRACWLRPLMDQPGLR